MIWSASTPRSSAGGSSALLREMQTLVKAGRLRYGLEIATFPTPCGPAWGHTGNVQGTIAVAWNTKDASRQSLSW